MLLSEFTQSVAGVSTVGVSQSSASLAHGHHQIVDGGLRDVFPFLLESHTELAGRSLELSHHRRSCDAPLFAMPTVDTSATDYVKSDSDTSVLSAVVAQRLSPEFSRNSLKFNAQLSWTL